MKKGLSFSAVLLGRESVFAVAMRTACGGICSCYQEKVVVSYAMVHRHADQCRDLHGKTKKKCCVGHHSVCLEKMAGRCIMFFVHNSSHISSLTRR